MFIVIYDERSELSGACLGKSAPMGRMWSILQSKEGNGKSQEVRSLEEARDAKQSADKTDDLKAAYLPWELQKETDIPEVVKVLIGWQMRWMETQAEMQDDLCRIVRCLVGAWKNDPTVKRHSDAMPWLYAKSAEAD